MLDRRDHLFAQRDKLLRRLWRDHWAWLDEDKARAGRRPPKLPDELRGLMCGAKNRQGGLCKRHDLCRNGRCKYHGGASTGPRTAAGKAVSSQNRRGKGLKRTP